MDIIDTLNAKIDELQAQSYFATEPKKAELKAEIQRLQFRIIELEKQGY